MFCPNCGKSDQRENTYCRRCGIFLPDFAKEGKREVSPEDHIKFNIVLNIMTAVVSLALSVLLFSFFFGKEDTSMLIYLTAGFLIAISAWQAQTIWRNFQLKKHFKQRKTDIAENPNPDSTKVFESFPTKELLNEANFADAIPASVLENTTSRLPKKIARKSS